MRTELTIAWFPPGLVLGHTHTMTNSAICMGLAAVFGLGAIALREPPRAYSAQAAENLICDLGTAASGRMLAICTGPSTIGDHDIVVTLFGTAPNRVDEVRISLDGITAPLQTIDLDARPVIDPETVGILYKDMNFDGQKDLAIMRDLSGENSGYYYFLYSPPSQRFERNSALEELPWPDFSTRRQRVFTYWISEHGRGRDEWQWRGGVLGLAGRTEWRIIGVDECVKLQTGFTENGPAQTQESACE